MYTSHFIKKKITRKITFKQYGVNSKRDKFLIKSTGDIDPFLFLFRRPLTFSFEVPQILL